MENKLNKTKPKNNASLKEQTHGSTVHAYILLHWALKRFFLKDHSIKYFCMSETFFFRNKFSLLVINSITSNKHALR